MFPHVDFEPIILIFTTGCPWPATQTLQGRKQGAGTHMHGRLQVRGLEHGEGQEQLLADAVLPSQLKVLVAGPLLHSNEN